MTSPALTLPPTIAKEGTGNFLPHYAGRAGISVLFADKGRGGGPATTQTRSTGFDAGST